MLGCYHDWFSLGFLAVTYTPLSVGIVLFRRRPAIGYSIVVVSIVLLAIDAARFARFKWTA
ncbi:MAG: hypothetical protein ACYDA1_06410 [Vulcanimicrobiaceae bacterium]